MLSPTLISAHKVLDMCVITLGVGDWEYLRVMYTVRVYCTLYVTTQKLTRTGILGPQVEPALHLHSGKKRKY